MKSNRSKIADASGARGYREPTRRPVAERVEPSEAGRAMRKAMVVAGIVGLIGLPVAYASDPLRVKAPADVPRFGGDTITEKVGIGSNPGALRKSTAPKLDVADRVRLNVYQREDISGEYPIRDDGTIVIPALGHFEAAGKSVKEIENSVADALMMATSAPVNVTVDVAQWRPIYILGGVDKPGIYPFTPGMTTLHALAAAGGVYRLGANNATIALDVARESGSFQQNLQRLKAALIKQSRLAAERLGADTIAAPPRLEEIASKAEIAQLVGAETQILKRRQAVRQNQTEMNAREIGTLEAELQALEAQYALYNERMGQLDEELTDLNKIARRGLATRQRVRVVERDAADARVQLPIVTANISRVKRQIEQVKRERDVKIAELDLEIDQQLAAVGGEVVSLELSLNQSRFLIGQIAGSRIMDASGGMVAAPVTYQVSRLVDGKMETVAADELTSLKPGDVMRVAGPGAGGVEQVSNGGMQLPGATVPSVGKAAYHPVQK